MIKKRVREYSPLLFQKKKFARAEFVHSFYLFILQRHSFLLPKYHIIQILLYVPMADAITTFHADKKPNVLNSWKINVVAAFNVVFRSRMGFGNDLRFPKHKKF